MTAPNIILMGEVVHHLLVEESFFSQILKSIKQATSETTKQDLMSILSQINETILHMIRQNRLFLYSCSLKLTSLATKSAHPNSNYGHSSTSAREQKSTVNNALQACVIKKFDDLQLENTRGIMTYERRTREYVDRFTFDMNSQTPMHPFTPMRFDSRSISYFNSPQQSQSSGYHSNGYGVNSPSSHFQELNAEKNHFFGSNTNHNVPSTSTPYSATNAANENFGFADVPQAVHSNYVKSSDEPASNILSFGFFDNGENVLQNSNKNKTSSMSQHIGDTSANLHQASASESYFHAGGCHTVTAGNTDNTAHGQKRRNVAVTKAKSYGSQNPSDHDHPHGLSKSKTDNNLYEISHGNICDPSQCDKQSGCDDPKSGPCSFRKWSQETRKVIQSFIYGRTRPLDRDWFEFARLGLELPEEMINQINNSYTNDSFARKYKKLELFLDRKRVSDPSLVEEELRRAIERMNEMQK